MNHIDDECEHPVAKNCLTGVRRLLAGANFSIAAAAITLVFSAATAEAVTLEEAKATGVTIAIANEPPTMQMNPDGTPGGWGPDLDAAILGELGVTEFSGQVMEYGAMIPALQSKRATLTSSGALFIRPERCEAILFSEPTSCNGEAFIMSATLAGKIKTFKDVADQGLKIGVCGGCSEQKMAIEAGVKEENIVVYPDGTSGLKLLKDNRIAVFANDATSTVALFTRANSPELHLVRIENIRSCAAAGFSKNDAELRDAYNEGLRRIRANGKYAELVKKYGLEEGARDIEKVSTAQLCGK
ncbi:ectoine/hydroxyectoine ABC transporter substrate-binding protein EhuB 2 (plasmid) [Rhizobium gallicum]|uniref:Ectoine/hydroxyectoine ABC transporter substrate-binding protein EhuB 2 n=1 Tax=Rhizobium gallicum TaxID=56730 RepID=A0A1L5NRA8_9HYPH|nr:ectoine/hydroxyectoine ABC transporter substrate-binding protein EhuB [Rhizobium gallicum]APO70389.1 ectoine/hydroxyectoine ABC transporter substrate-binding protein EhuB 2 [Rhizobium gallicum]